MSDPWLFAGIPEGAGPATVTLIEGTTFCVSGPNGDLAETRPGGLFVRDTRILSVCDLYVGGHHVSPLRMHFEAPYAALYLGEVTLASKGGPLRLLVARRRVIGEGMREEITVTNCTSRACDVKIALHLATDLADLFQVKEGRATGAPVRVRAVGARRRGARRAHDRSGGSDPDRRARLELGVDNQEYGAVALADGPVTIATPGCLWLAHLPGHGSWTRTVEIMPKIQGRLLAPHHPTGRPMQEALPYRRRSEWWADAPVLQAPDRVLVDVLRTSVEDLGTLRIFDPLHVERPVIAAGSPWFMALFGRDALITSLMLLPLDTALAEGTCRTLAAHQGRRHDAVTEEEPGRILHELRMGPAATSALGGGSAYFGTADATPLFVMALGQLLRWAGPEAITPDLVSAADQALGWLAGDGDRDGDGFVEYERRTTRGLRNQGWKDSWDGVNFADGRLGEPPVALAEVQGYAYAAYVARAEIAVAVEDGHVAHTWLDRAAALRQEFDDRFWLPDRGWYAAGLDGQKRPIDALTSSLGHLLWTGIVPQGRASTVADLLVSPELFTGWGIRTLASTMMRYDPMSYHNGSVWPHDTAICVAGLSRYGFREQAATVAMGLLDAAGHFDNRLPELFGGFERGTPAVPVPVPGACSPQAWASAAPVELLRALLGLGAGDGGLLCQPSLPPRMRPLRLSGVRCRQRSYDVDITADGDVRVS